MKMLDDMRTIKQLLTDAERIAREMGEEEPGAEHLLLSAIGLPDGSAARVLGSLGMDADGIRTALRAEQADALVAAGVPRETAEAMAEPDPLGPAGAPLLYGAGPSARRARSTPRRSSTLGSVPRSRPATAATTCAPARRCFDERASLPASWKTSLADGPAP